MTADQPHPPMTGDIAFPKNSSLQYCRGKLPRADNMNKTLPDLVLFDLDNTLLTGDSDVAWGDFLCDMGLVEKDKYRQLNNAFYEQYHAGQLDIIAYLRFALAPLATIPPQQLTQLREQFMAERIDPMITQAALELVEKHRHAGALTAIITATNRFIAEPIAACFKVDHLIATEPERRNGRFTGEVAGTPCFREGKLKCLQQWFERENPDYGRTWCYSDSHNDLALLSWADQAVVVDGDPELRAYATARSWPMISLTG